MSDSAGRPTGAAEVGGQRVSQHLALARTLDGDDPLLARLIDDVPALVWTADRHHRLTWIGGGLLRQLACSPRRSVPMRMQDCLGTDDPAHPVLAAHYRALRGEGSSSTLEWRTRWFAIHVEPLRALTGAIIGSIGAAVDTTGQRQSEHARHSAEESVNAIAAQRTDPVGVLAAGIVHDFNNILSAIGGCADLLRRRLPTPDTELELIQEAVASAASLTQQFVGLIRGETLPIESFDPGARIALMERLLCRLAGMDVALRVRLDENVPPIRFVPTQFDQMLFNLVINARDAIAGSGTVEVRTCFNDDHVELSVADDGVGMDEGVRARIFEPFFTTKANGQGTGLGLATVHAIVTRHSGEIKVESERSRGTRITVRLPAWKAATDKARLR
jgi:signal transduction histidine kinase